MKAPPELFPKLPTEGAAHPALVGAPSSPPGPKAVGGDEATLAARALGGDGAAWSALVQKHNHRVVVSLLARGVRIDRAKDIAQDAWMRLVEQQVQCRLASLSLA